MSIFPRDPTGLHTRLYALLYLYEVELDPPYHYPSYDDWVNTDATPDLSRPQNSAVDITPLLSSLETLSHPTNESKTPSPPGAKADSAGNIFIPFSRPSSTRGQLGTTGTPVSSSDLLLPCDQRADVGPVPLAFDHGHSNPDGEDSDGRALSIRGQDPVGNGVGRGRPGIPPVTVIDCGNAGLGREQRLIGARGAGDIKSMEE